MFQVGLIVLVSLMSLTSMAGKIPGVPNDLRRKFKSIHKSEEIYMEMFGTTVRARKHPVNGVPVLFYELPEHIKDQKIQEWVKNIHLDSSYDFHVVESGGEAQKYDVYYQGQKVDHAFLNVYRPNDLRPSFGFYVPMSLSDPIQFENASNDETRLGLFGQTFTEYRIKKTDEEEYHYFPLKTGLNAKTLRTVSVQLAKGGVIKKYKLPEGRFPDQIMSDSQNRIWLSQPSNNFVSRFNPETEKWEQITVGDGPDGIYIDSKDRLWFGEYDEGALGVLNTKTGSYHNIPLPYKSSNPAIPYEDHLGTIWLTDHQNNKIIHFDPFTESFLKVLEVPTARAWPVELIQTANKKYIYTTECYANKIGQIEVATYKYREIPLSTNACPAFFTPVGNDLWITLWSDYSLMHLAPESQKIVQYKIDDPKAIGGFGPIGKLPDGRIVVGALQSERVYAINPKTLSATYIEGVGRLKDGLTVDRKGRVWVTESGPYIYQLTFP